MLKGYATIPGRMGNFSHNTMELDPAYWQVELIGRIQLETDTTCQITVNDKLRSVNNSALLLVFKDKISGKLFWWEGLRSHADSVKLSREDKTYRFWPCEFYQITKHNVREFFYYIQGFGCDFVMDAEQREKVNKRKAKMIEAIKDSIRQRKEVTEEEDQTA